MNGLGFSKGVTLVELMISLTLGLMISAAAIQLYVTHRATLNTQRALSLILEQGRYAQELLTAQMKLSGYGGHRGAVGSFVFSEVSDGNKYDVLEIQIAGAGTDCMGGPLAEESGVKRKRFYVKKDVLLCSDSDGIHAPVIQNVDLFQVVYGLDLDTLPLSDKGYGSADIYVNGDALTSESSLQVVSVKIALVIKSEGSIERHLSEQPQKTVWVLDEAIVDNFTSSQDGYLRRLFTSTTAIRNFARS